MHFSFSDSEFSNALDMDGSSFESKYGFEKPAHDAAIVTHCTSGTKAMRALDILTAHGYTNAK